MLVGVPPFLHDDKHKLFKKIIIGELDFKFYDEKIKISKDAKDLIYRLLHKNPNMRIKPEDIPYHGWFNGLNFNEILQGKVKSHFVPKVKSFDDFSNIDKEFLDEECFSPQKRRIIIEEHVKEEKIEKLGKFINK
jgi:serine/threonine protein kinase